MKIFYVAIRLLSLARIAAHSLVIPPLPTRRNFTLGGRNICVHSFLAGPERSEPRGVEVGRRNGFRSIGAG